MSSDNYQCDGSLSEAFKAKARETATQMGGEILMEKDEGIGLSFITKMRIDNGKDGFDAYLKIFVPDRELPMRDGAKVRTTQIKKEEAELLIRHHLEPEVSEPEEKEA